jgi:hypothetical protein
MIPAGYLAKHISSRPEWLKTIGVVDIYSLSEHVSPAFADYVPYWRHNGFWLFDSPDIIQRLAEEHSIDLEGTTFFYYEVYALEIDETERRWTPFESSPFETKVRVPARKRLEGYDIVTFWTGTSPECSPLSCNSLAKSIKTNEHCLLASLDGARHLLGQGAFDNSEPGPFRIWAVYSLV